MKNATLEEANTALDFTLCCVSLLTCPLMVYFPYSAFTIKYRLYFKKCTGLDHRIESTSLHCSYTVRAFGYIF